MVFIKQAYLMKAFPETEASYGIIESSVVDVPKMRVRLEQQYDTPILGRLMLKKDSHLPISGSIKATSFARTQYGQPSRPKITVNISLSSI